MQTTNCEGHGIIHNAFKRLEEKSGTNKHLQFSSAVFQTQKEYTHYTKVNSIVD